MLTRLRSLFVALILVVMGAMPVCAQTIQAKGKVIDSEGKALAGVSVSAKQDKALHTTTASDGTFSIQVAEKDDPCLYSDREANCRAGSYDHAHASYSPQCSP